MRIFFDVDGVIMDNIHTVKGWIKRWDTDLEKDLGVHPDKFQEIFKDWFPVTQLGKLDFEKEMERWLKWHDYDVKAWQVINYWNEKDTNVNDAVYGVVQSLSKIDDVYLSVATNQTHERARYLWDVFGFKNYFKDIYYSAELGHMKHDPEFFRKIEEELDFDPRLEPPLYFDDDPENIGVASTRGWDAVLVNNTEDICNHYKIRALLSA